MDIINSCSSGRSDGGIVVGNAGRQFAHLRVPR